MTLLANEIAEKFSKGQACQFWLTKKQACWLLDVWHRENPKANTHFGRTQAGGQFENENGAFFWEAKEGYHGSALFEVTQYTAQETKTHPLEELIASKGLNFMEVMTNPDPELINGLLEELKNR